MIFGIVKDDGLRVSGRDRSAGLSAAQSMQGENLLIYLITSNFS